MRRFIHTYNIIISVVNLFLSWQEFSRDKKKRKFVILFSMNLMDNIFDLHSDLKNKTYKHNEYQAFKINDPKPRDIHKASVKDRLCHHAIYRILYPYFDKKFIYDSYSCRLGKGTHRAIYRFESFIRKVSKNGTQPCWVLKGDIKKFFANIDHQILKNILAKYIQDQDILYLLGNVINSFSSKAHISHGVYVPHQHISPIVEMCHGLPLGNLTSQLLVNIYMNEFDQFVKRELKIEYYIRYADDFVVLSQDKEYLENVLEQMKKFLGNHLKLTMHPDKVFIKTIYSGIDFLGWVHFAKHRVLRTSTKRRMFRRIEEVGKKMETIQSYLGMLSHGNAKKLQNKIFVDYFIEKE